VAADRRSDRPPGDASDRPGRGSARPQTRSNEPRGQQRRGQPDRKPAERRPRERRDEPDRRAEPARPGLARPPREPSVPDGVDTRTLHRAVRAELRSLPKDLAEIVAGHLVMAGQLVDSEPEVAYAHAEAARRRAARLPIVREAAAETAYAAGRYDVALSEFRALRRMTGSDDYLPVMADCERALGRPQNALKLAKESERRDLDPALRVEMTIVEAGARADLGQHREARRILERAVNSGSPSPELALAHARLRYAYADLLLRAGQQAEARDWFVSAAGLDSEQETDAQQRVDELDGFLIDFDDQPEPED
jgi:tetratricopeptide (TPR) repeat protein